MIIQLCLILVTMTLHRKVKCLLEVSWQKCENANHIELLYSFTKFGFYYFSQGFPGGSYGKESACNSGDLGSIPGEKNGYLLQYSCLENFMNRGACQATVHGVTRVGHTERLSIASSPLDLMASYNQITTSYTNHWNLFSFCCFQIMYALCLSAVLCLVA